MICVVGPLARSPQAKQPHAMTTCHHSAPSTSRAASANLLPGVSIPRGRSSETINLRTLAPYMGQKQGISSEVARLGLDAPLVGPHSASFQRAVRVLRYAFWVFLPLATTATPRFHVRAEVLGVVLPLHPSLPVAL